MNVSGNFPRETFRREPSSLGASLSTLIFHEACICAEIGKWVAANADICGIYSYKFLTDANP